MTRLALCLLLLATGASAEQLTRSVEVIHDDKRAVTCWVYADYYRGGIGGISCIPDSQLSSPTTVESQISRAYAPTSMWKNEQLPPYTRYGAWALD